MGNRDGGNWVTHVQVFLTNVWGGAVRNLVMIMKMYKKIKKLYLNTLHDRDSKPIVHEKLLSISSLSLQRSKSVNSITPCFSSASFSAIFESHAIAIENKEAMFFFQFSTTRLPL
jgi:hypothetical protein